MLCAQRQDRHCRVALEELKTAPYPPAATRSRTLVTGCTVLTLASGPQVSCSVYSSRSHFEHRKGPNLTSSWLDPFLNLALGDTLISVFLWSFPRRPHLCFSWVISQTPSSLFVFGCFPDTFIFVFLWSFPRYPHLCFSLVVDLAFKLKIV